MQEWSTHTTDGQVVTLTEKTGKYFASIKATQDSLVIIFMPILCSLEKGARKWRCLRPAGVQKGTQAPGISHAASLYAGCVTLLVAENKIVTSSVQHIYKQYYGLYRHVCKLKIYAKKTAEAIAKEGAEERVKAAAAGSSTLPGGQY